MRIALQNMRMSCNSTYLLDQKTDHGVKADELLDLLGEIFEDPQSKVVIFSQWVRMHELVVRRLQKRKWGYVLFHGGVPGPKRKDLIQRFKEEPACRLFLSTDAGGVGLNLQHASAVVNLDQPWNPAVLEQRIGRVHRLGQRRPVRVVHFIAQGTIEEGMLSLLSFKRSMFAGVLDDGQDEVFMGGTRLKQFLESVEKATGSIPPSMPQQVEARPAVGEEAKEEAAAAAVAEDATAAKRAAPAKAGKPSAAPREQLWTDVLTAGMSLLDKLGQMFGSGGAQAAQGGLPRGILAQDHETGQPYLKLPLPAPETMQKIVELLGALSGAR
jgi:superfamily II DNA/RNA helicase